MANFTDKPNSVYRFEVEYRFTKNVYVQAENYEEARTFIENAASNESIELIGDIIAIKKCFPHLEDDQTWHITDEFMEEILL